MGPCILEVHKICTILVKSVDSWLFGRINSCLENFVFLTEKWSLFGFGHCHGDLAVK